MSTVQSKPPVRVRMSTNARIAFELRSVGFDVHQDASIGDDPGITFKVRRGIYDAVLYPGGDSLIIPLAAFRGIDVATFVGTGLLITAHDQAVDLVVVRLARESGKSIPCEGCGMSIDHVRQSPREVVYCSTRCYHLHG